MKIISIDPGYERLGIAIIEKKNGQRENLLYSECFKTSKTLPHEKRLELIGQKIKEIISFWQPEKLVIEKLFLTTNHKTVMNVSEARGVILQQASIKNLDVFEFSPPQIKLAVTGSGKADKKAIIKMVPLMIKIDKKIDTDDEFDAIAIGLTFFAIHKV